VGTNVFLWDYELLRSCRNQGPNQHLRVATSCSQFFYGQWLSATRAVSLRFTPNEQRDGTSLSQSHAMLHEHRRGKNPPIKLYLSVKFYRHKRCCWRWRCLSDFLFRNPNAEPHTFEHPAPSPASARPAGRGHCSTAVRPQPPETANIKRSVGKKKKMLWRRRRGTTTAVRQNPPVPIPGTRVVTRFFSTFKQLIKKICDKKTLINDRGVNQKVALRVPRSMGNQSAAGSADQAFLALFSLGLESGGRSGWPLMLLRATRGISAPTPVLAITTGESGNDSETGKGRMGRIRYPKAVL